MIEIKEFYICNADVLVFSICCFSHGVFRVRNGKIELV